MQFSAKITSLLFDDVVLVCLFFCLGCFGSFLVLFENGRNQVQNWSKIQEESSTYRSGWSRIFPSVEASLVTCTFMVSLTLNFELRCQMTLNHLCLAGRCDLTLHERVFPLKFFMFSQSSLCFL